MTSQIMAIGGGGFTNPYKDYSMERYILEHCGKDSPRVGFLPQASSENKDYTVMFYQAFQQLGARPKFFSLFGRVAPSWQEELLDQDVIYVGGGNTRSMMALWKEWGVDDVLRQAYKKGVLLAGVSAGAICWYEQGITDSVWPLGTVPCLGLLPGSACPHYNGEPERKPTYLQMVKEGRAMPGIAIEDKVIAHYKDGALFSLKSFEEHKTAYWISQQGEESLSVSS